MIFVHGTYAGDDSDSGAEWWQVGSDFWDTIVTLLPDHVSPDAKQVFHWSGANSEFERSKAGSMLLSRLRNLESSGVPYHLVGHSHGGSVIW